MIQCFAKPNIFVRLIFVVDLRLKHPIKYVIMGSNVGQ
jgi:hypothetical protein